MRFNPNLYSDGKVCFSLWKCVCLSESVCVSMKVRVSLFGAYCHITTLLHYYSHITENIVFSYCILILLRRVFSYYYITSARILILLHYWCLYSCSTGIHDIPREIFSNYYIHITADTSNVGRNENMPRSGERDTHSKERDTHLERETHTLPAWFS